MKLSLRRAQTTTLAKASEETSTPAAATSAGALFARAVALIEPLDAPTGVNQLLLARIEGVALVAELRGNCRHGRLGRKGVSTRTADLGLFVIGMDVSFHGKSFRRRAPSRRTEPANRSGVIRIPRKASSGAGAGVLGDFGKELVVALCGLDLVHQQFQTSGGAAILSEGTQYTPQLPNLVQLGAIE